ncbi:MAG: class I SAM-dependent methyltransferase [Alphaproteobacteria bacterium]|nr:class I SAM-dependent methyltransferase [Alphaproteobacteria bacterium]
MSAAARTPPTGEPSQSWDPDRYRREAGFVAELGLPVLDLLDPRPGERILDLGCGEGALTAKLAAAGAQVVGVDASPEQIARARDEGLDAHVVDGQALASEAAFEAAFDAVFTNAALHWMKRDPDAVIAGVARALKPGGRFVGEFGGAGNVAAIRDALRAELSARGIDPAPYDPWFFPSVDDYRARLEAGGFAVREIALIPRPTPLPGDISGWLSTFGESFLNALPEADRADAVAAARARLAPVLAGPDGSWTADYVRLRFAADLVEAREAP